MPQFLVESLPRTVEEFKRLRDVVATTPIGGAAMFAVALNAYADDPRLGVQFLTLALDAGELVDGPEGVAGKQPMSLRAFKERNGGKPWVARSMFQGATPENGYALPSPPLVIEYREQTGDLRGDDARVFIQTTGADHAKPLRLRRNDKGVWKATEWSSFQGNCRPPVTRPSDDL